MSADCFRCKVRWDRRASVARGAAPCTERSDAKQPEHTNVRAVCLAERTYSRQESIEVRPLFQRDSSQYGILIFFKKFSIFVAVPSEASVSSPSSVSSGVSKTVLMLTATLAQDAIIFLESAL